MKKQIDNNSLAKASVLHLIVLIDGNCILCDGISICILKRDQNDRIRIGLLQDFQSIDDLDKDVYIPETVIVIDKERYYYKSEAFFKVISVFPFYWKAFYLFKLIPIFILNYFYDFIAKNRYNIFGKKETCSYPTKAQLSKIIKPIS